jgi:hypothetical protein
MTTHVDPDWLDVGDDGEPDPDPIVQTPPDRHCLVEGME